MKYLVTSALPYVNNVPHLGNIIGCVLSADVFARYLRSQGREVLYVCGTDEHGTTTEAKAIEEGVTPKEICEKYYKIHKEIYEWFGCSFDVFGRTSDKTHHELTQEIFKKVDMHGYATEKELEQLHCPECNRFLSDRFVLGRCPKCGYEGARGDQCEKCGKLLEPTELENPKCKICGARPEMMKTKHLFFELPKIEKPLHDWTHKQAEAGQWTENARSTTETWFREGLQPRCITRDLSWGVTVPKKGYENKVFYVWFDAPIGYISATKKERPDWDKWWKGKDTKLYQFMAKDNIPFHTILFPATLMAANDGYVLLHHINSTEYLNYEGGKFSKSQGTGVFGDDAIESGIPADVWRYYLLANRPETADTEFKWDDFQQKNNNELLANLGNFVNRTLTFLKKNWEAVPAATPTEAEQQFLKQAKETAKKATEHLENVELKDGLRTIMLLAKSANAYFQEQQPWKQEEPRKSTIIATCANIVAVLGALAEPYLPNTSKNIFKQLNMPPMTIQYLQWDTIQEGHEIGTPEPLFQKLEDSQIQEMRGKYGGQPFGKLDLKVAKIEKAEPHPNADKLYVLEVDVGTEKRTLCAGLKEHYTPEELEGKLIVIVANLEPAKLRGVMSEGMLLAGDKNGKVELVSPQDAHPGDHVSIESVAPQAGKISIEEFQRVKLTTKDGVVVHKGKPLKTQHGTVKCDLPDGATIR